MNSTTKTLLALSSGLLVGVVAGILTAPKSGKETREDLKNGISDLKKKAQDLKKTASELTEKGKESVKETVNAAKNSMAGDEEKASRASRS